MAKQKKVVNVLSKTALAGMVASAMLTSQAFAAVDAYTVKVGGEVFEYNKSELVVSYLDYTEGLEAPLFEAFTAKLSEGKGVYAYHDDANGYVSFGSVSNAFLNAEEGNFDLNVFTESEEAEVLAVPTVKKAVVVDGQVEYNEEGEEVTGDLKVESVSAINAAQIKIVFNKKVDEDAAETTSNYSVNNSTSINVAELQEDGKTVILTTTALSNTKDYTVTIKTDIEDADGTKLEAKVTEKIDVNDIQLPSVEYVKAKGDSAIEIKFSEPVNNLSTAANFVINDTTFTGAPVVSTDKTKVELPVSLPQGENKLEIVDSARIADFAGYNLPLGEFKFDVDATQAVTQAVSATFIDQTTVQVEFDKAVNLSESTNYSTQFYWNKNGTSDYKQYKADTSNTVEKVNDTTFKVNFTGTSNYLKTGDLYFFVDGVTDYFGNAVPEAKFELTATADALPVVDKVETPAEDTIKITFDKVLDSSSTYIKKSNFTVKDSDGEEQELKSVSYSNKVITITTSDKLSGGDYTVEYKNLESVTGNELPTATETATITDKTAITSVTAGAVSATEDYILVTFDEAMATDGDFSIGEKDKYEYRVNGGSWTELGDNDELEVVDNKTAKITFDSETFANTNTVEIRVALVADVAGNINSVKAESGAVTAIDTTAKLALNGLVPEIKDLRTIEITIPRKLNAISGSDFIVKNVTDSEDIMPASATFENSDTKTESTITLTLSDDLDLDKQYKVNTNTSVSDTKDSNDLLLEDGTGATISGLAVNAIAPTIKNISYQDNRHLVVEFDKAVNMVIASDFKVTDGEDTYTATGVGATATASTFNAITTTSDSVYVLAFGDDITTSAKLSTVDEPQTEDGQDNKLVGATDVVVSDFRVTSVALKDGDGTTALKADDSIEIKFSEAVDAADLISDLRTYQSTNAATSADEWDGSEVTLDQANFVQFGNDNAATTSNDSLTFASTIGTFDLGANDVVAAGVNVSDVKVKLTDGGKTLTITFTTDESANVTAANINGAKFSAAKAFQAESDVYADAEYITFTASEF